MKDLLQRLQRALPQVGQWIDDLRVRHLPRAIPPSELGFTRPASCLPGSLLNTARVALVDRIPFPPVSQYGLPEFEAMASMPMAGITFGDMYFVQPSYASEGIHFHELVHVVLWSTLGMREFLLTYALGIAQYGYLQSPLEAMAFDLQAQFEQGALLLSVAERVARHAAEAREAASTMFRMHGLKLGA